MTIEERIDLLQQAISKTREAYDAVSLVDVEGPYTTATYHLGKALEMLTSDEANCKSAILKAKAQKLQHERLCKELNIKPFDLDED